MNILYATDDNYADIANVSIRSLLEHHRHIPKISIFIVEDQLSKTSLQRLRKAGEDYQRDIYFIPKPNISKLAGTQISALRWSDSAFSRLCIDDLFEGYPWVDKVLYLDCDTMVVNSVDELWGEDISGRIGAAVLECMSNWHKKLVGNGPEDGYFNSGVMLINVKEWKEQNVSDRCWGFLRKHNGRVEYVDQGVINGVLAKELKVIPPRYNLTAMAWDLTYEEMQIYRKPSIGYSKDEWEAAVANPAIIHFTTSFLSRRPWFEGSERPYTSEWREWYKKVLEGEEKPFTVKSESFWNKAFRAMSRSVAIRIAGMAHSYWKPVGFYLGII